MSQPGHGQQPGRPHASVSGAAPHGSFEEVDLANLRAHGKDFVINLALTEHDAYVPSWSHPLWHEQFEFTYDGDASYVLEWKQGGDSTNLRRAALLPGDSARLPTDYARRFGMHHDQDPRRDQWAHSSMTPTDMNFQTSPQAPEADKYDRDLQMMFLNYTTEELVRQGAFNPAMQGLSWPPDLDDESAPIHSLLARHRWTQMPLTVMEKWDGHWNIKYGPEVDGVGGDFDARDNQKVWDAIEPAVRLASLVLRSGHPFWEAITNIYHYRPVDLSKDGRTAEQRAARGGAPFTSVWPNLGDPRVPAPYPEMLRLRELDGCGDAELRDLCLGFLDQTLQMGIHFDGVKTEGMTVRYTDGRNAFAVRSLVSANFIWPLLLPQHQSNGERMAHTFRIASTILQ